MRKLLLFLIFLLINCGEVIPMYRYTDVGGYYEGREVPIWVDAEFGEVDKVGIDDAVKQWNYVLNGRKRLKVVSYQFRMEPELIREIYRDGGWMILKINGDNSMVVDGIMVGVVDGIGGI